MTYPLAVCALILKQDGSVMTVSRKSDPTKWGLPGGKLDGLETPTQAVVREVKEETGFDMDESKLIAIYTDICPGEVTYNVTTFYYDEAGPDDEDIVPEEGLQVKYISDHRALTEEVNSPFANYNKGVLLALARRIVKQLRNG